ncbi:MAG TPA: alpha-amylase/4-alpha-glucanotransferase domain-containing protein, partial [candidate division Zixibacteria bacterium]|nr:alpha-amylase/4-alpha-glucanotransferase domain-containing protein [candidate division Zixibacteria bacterium]
QQRLRYLIPFGTIEQVISELKIQAEANPHGLAIYADDGEKFGVWPETYKHCYEDKWLESFFDALVKNSDWLEVIPLGEAAQRKPAGRAYLPTASYSEMLHWALPGKTFVEYEHFESWLKEQGQFERFGRFVRGGHWRNFLAKYEESNLMHKKMLDISSRLAEYESDHPAKSKLLNTIRELMYSGQCNCPYWHGVFGGLYLPHIRQAVYSNLLDAEQKLNKLEKRTGLSVREFDWDSDGSNEILTSNDHYSTVFKPSRGGMLVDFSLLGEHFNLTDTLSRRREGYHRKLEQKAGDTNDNKTASIHDRVISKEKNLDRYLISDWYLKRCFIDHFFGENISFDEFQKNKFNEGGDFILEPYLSVIDKKHHSIILSRDGNIRGTSGSVKINLKKTFVFTQDGFIKINYQLSSPDQSNLKVTFGIENNFSFQAGHAEDRFVLINGIRPKDAFLDSAGEQNEVSSFAMVDEYRQLAVALESDRNCTFWRLPIFTVSLSEGGFEKVYQGTTLVNLYELDLSKAPIELNLSLWAGNLKHLPAQFRIKS